MGFPGCSVVKNLPAKQETRVQSLGREDPLAKEMATHSSIFAWEIPWTEEPGRLLFVGLQRVRHDLASKPQQQHNHSFISLLLLLDSIVNSLTLLSPRWAAQTGHSCYGADDRALKSSVTPACPGTKGPQKGLASGPFPNVAFFPLFQTLSSWKSPGRSRAEGSSYVVGKWQSLQTTLLEAGQRAGRRQRVTWH